MHYSEYPHSQYIIKGIGPGHNFVGDVEMWNWRWLLHGEGLDENADAALPMFFNDSQRQLMQMAPMKAADIMSTFLKPDVMDVVWERARKAEDRLFPTLVSTVQGNVIHANFRRN